MIFDDGAEEGRWYNIVSESDNCTLLPEGERNRFAWYVPSARYTRSFGFGQSMLWYPTEDTAKEYLNNLLHNIENYEGDNWLDKFPDM